MHVRIWVFGLSLVMVCLWACAPTETPPPDPPLPRKPPPVSQEAPVRHEFTLVDKSRVTPATPEDEEKPQRTLRMYVWVGKMAAEEAGTFPLLVMAHGLNGSIERFQAIATYIASQGIVVAAPAFPLTHEAPGRKPAVGIVDLKEQPADIRLAIDWLLTAVKEEASPLYRRFDPTKTVGLGHSYGGATMLGLTRYECCAEKRLLASILIAPSTQVNALAFKAPKPSPEGPPTLLIHGKQDMTLQYQGSVDLYDAFMPDKFFVGLPDASHSDLIESQDEPPIPSRKIVQELVVAFVKAHTVGAKSDFAKALAGVDAQANEVKQDVAGQD